MLTLRSIWNVWAWSLGVFKILLAPASWVSLCDLEAGEKRGFGLPLFNLFGCQMEISQTLSQYVVS